MGMVYKLPLTPQQVWNGKTFFRIRILWQNMIVGSPNDVLSIVAGTYYPVGGDGEGELNGVPTAADIENIIAETYTHHDVEIDEYGLKPEEIPTVADVENIISGRYVPTSAASDAVISGGDITPADIDEIIGSEEISDSDIDAIISGTYGG